VTWCGGTYWRGLHDVVSEDEAHRANRQHQHEHAERSRESPLCPAHGDGLDRPLGIGPLVRWICGENCGAFVVPIHWDLPSLPINSNFSIRVEVNRFSGNLKVTKSSHVKRNGRRVPRAVSGRT